MLSCLSPRSAPSLVRTVVEEARGEGLPLLSLGSCSYAEVHSCVSRCVSIWSSPWSRPTGWAAWLAIRLLHFLSVWPWSLSLVLILTETCQSASHLLVGEVPAHRTCNKAPSYKLTRLVEQLPPLTASWCSMHLRQVEGMASLCVQNRSNEWMKMVKGRKIGEYIEKTQVLWLPVDLH